MPYQKYAVVFQKLQLKTKALGANLEELPHLKQGAARLDELLVLLNDLTVEQARLTARRQEVSKQIEELVDEAQKLMTFLDIGVKQHYGKQSEKLAAYGLQPFRGRRKPQKKEAVDAESPASTENQ
jgi:uncharacterized protein YPO0396